MKVLMINSVCGIRSTGRICTDIAQLLAAQGHDSKIAYGRENVPEQYRGYGLRIGTEVGVRFHGLRTRILDETGFGSKLATRRLVRQIREYDPDLIHLHNIHGYYLNIEILFDYLKEAKKPVVWTLHDCWTFTGHCAYFTAAGCDKWKTGCGGCMQKTCYPASFLKDSSAENYRRKKAAFTGVDNLTLVTPSRWLAELAGRSYLREYPVQVIYNGINEDVFKPTPSDFRERYNLQSKYIVMGAASNWDGRKGMADFIKLSSMLGEDYAIVLVGITPEQKNHLPREIIGIPRTENPVQLARIYTAADVFVNPTYEDNYPTVNLEAQACGTPVITYRTGGSVESVPEDCVIDCGDVTALAEKIRERTAVCKEDLQLDRQSMLNSYLDLYRRLLNRQ